MGLRRASLVILLIASFRATSHSASASEADAVWKLFSEHCFDCHATVEPEGGFVLETYPALRQGGDSGQVIQPGNSEESLLVRYIEGRVTKDGEQKFMPPGSKRRKLIAEEIASIRRWIDAGAPAPDSAGDPTAPLSVPKIDPEGTARLPVQSIAYAPQTKWLAVAQADRVALRSAESRGLIRTLSGARGLVNSVAFSPDGKGVFAAAGEPSRFGEVRQWNASDGALVRVFQGHADAIYALALSPDGAWLATGSYDQKILLWNTATGEPHLTLSGHNGCVFGLAFRPDGKILASASADRTVKLWDVATGERRETLSQSLEDLHAVLFHKDGRWLFAGGVDHRIRWWNISQTATETTNPLLEARFAHEGAILALAASANGRWIASAANDGSVKIWEADGLQERHLLDPQPDWPPALAFALEDKALVVGRLDGSLEYYDADSGKVLPPPKPALTKVEPRGIERGRSVTLRLTGTNLVRLEAAQAHHPKLRASLLDPVSENAGQTSIELTADPDLPPGGYEISVSSRSGESGRLTVHVDNIPQFEESSEPSTAFSLPVLPACVWGGIDPAGDADEFQFTATAGETLVVDVAAHRLGSKAALLLTLMDDQRRLLSSNRSLAPSPDPLLSFTVPTNGIYLVRVEDVLLSGSPDHFYRLAIGSFPLVTACYPLSAPAHTNLDLELIGFNLPPEPRLSVTTTDPGSLALPIDPDRFRTRGALNLLITSDAESLESEPNDTPATAQTVPAPAVIHGRFYPVPAADGTGPNEDVDLFQFHAQAGQQWIIETDAARRGSPADTRIEVLRPDGSPVPRLLLQAVRNSAVNFRPVDANAQGARLDHWEEMTLRQFLYWNGEVVRLFRMPQGPDSEMLFYRSSGKRRAYFDTTPVSHPLEESCFIVEPRPPDTPPVANGLPAFTLCFVNDDDGDRKLGADSQIHFTAPADGSYLVRVTDTRGFHGDRFSYRLVLRQPKPDFKVTMDPSQPEVHRGSGRGFSLSADRLDGFEGSITVEFDGVPSGVLVTSPIVIEEGLNEARGMFFVSPDASLPSADAASPIRVRAWASVDGVRVDKEILSIAALKVATEPKLFVSLLPAGADVSPERPPEIVIAPGQTIPARLAVRRNGHDDLITFDVENLPHGVIVDNIGLNGVLMPKDQTEREIFLTCSDWVSETDRWIYARENQAGGQTSPPALLKVRNPAVQK